MPNTPPLSLPSPHLTSVSGGSRAGTAITHPHVAEREPQGQRDQPVLSVPQTLDGQGGWAQQRFASCPPAWGACLARGEVRVTIPGSSVPLPLSCFRADTWLLSSASLLPGPVLTCPCIARYCLPAFLNTTIFPPFPFLRWQLTVLPRLALNPWTQMILLPQPPHSWTIGLGHWA